MFIEGYFVPSFSCKFRVQKLLEFHCGVHIVAHNLMPSVQRIFFAKNVSIAVPPGKALLEILNRYERNCPSNTLIPKQLQNLEILNRRERNCPSKTLISKQLQNLVKNRNTWCRTIQNWLLQ